MDNLTNNNDELDAFGLTGSEEEAVEGASHISTEEYLGLDTEAADVSTEGVAAAVPDEDDGDDFDDEDDDFDSLFDDVAAPEVNGPYVTVVGGGSQQRYTLPEGATVASFVEANNFSRGAGVVYFVNGVSSTTDRVLVSGDTLLVQQNMKGGAR